MKEKLLKTMRVLLVAVLLGVGSITWGQEAAGSYKYFNTFDTSTGLTIHGTGSFDDDADSRFGKVFQNVGGALRTNYLQLPDGLFSHSANSQELTIGFWVNKKAATGTYSSATPLFTAYSSSTSTSWPMLRCSLGGSLQLNHNGYCDFGDALNDAGTNSGDITWINDNEWHYYTVVFTATTAKVYVDGSVVNSWTVDGTSAGQVFSGMLNNAEDGSGNKYAYFCLGGNQAWDWGIAADQDPGFAFDDFMVTNEALTQAQISDIINFKKKAVTTTLDFKEFTKPLGKKSEKTLVVTSTEVSVAGETLYVADDQDGMLLYNYIALPSGKTARSSANAGSTGDSDGLWAWNTNYKFAITNLHVGDKVVITWGKSSGGTVQFRSTNATYEVESVATAISENQTVTSGTEYTVSSGTQLDFYMGGGSTSGSTYINSIAIISVYDGVSNPTLKETGASGVNKTITISNGVSSHSNTVTTYYTIDGSVPTSSNYEGSFTTATKDVIISSSCTVKAVAISSDGSSSLARTLDVEAGAKTPLNTPSSTLTGMSATDGKYYPVYTFFSDNSDITGTPTATSYTYTFTPTSGDVDSGTLTDGKFTFTTTGTLEVVANITSETYDNSDAKSVTVPTNYVLTNSIDVADIYGDYASNGNNEWPSVDYTLIPYTTFSPISTSGCQYRTKHNSDVYNHFYARNSTAFTANCDGLENGEVIVFSNSNKEDYPAVTSLNTSITVPGGGNLKYFKCYIPATVTKNVSVGSAGLATYTSDMSLDYSTVSASIIPYKATVSGSTVTLTKATVVPAGEGVLLRSVSGEAVNDVAVPVASYSAWTAAENAFVGTIKDITVNQVSGTNTNFVLSKEDNVVGFFKAKAEGDGGTAVGAGKAYLPVPTANLSEARRMTMVFDDETTGISDATRLMNNEEIINGEIYDLQGRKVTNPTKGLYIVNGIKVIIK